MSGIIPRGQPPQLSGYTSGLANQRHWSISYSNLAERSNGYSEPIIWNALPQHVYDCCILDFKKIHLITFHRHINTVTLLRPGIGSNFAFAAVI